MHHFCIWARRINSGDLYTYLRQKHFCNVSNFSISDNGRSFSDKFSILSDKLTQQRSTKVGTLTKVSDKIDLVGSAAASSNAGMSVETGTLRLSSRSLVMLPGRNLRFGQQLRSTFLRLPNIWPTVGGSWSLKCELYFQSKINLMSMTCTQLEFRQFIQFYSKRSLFIVWNNIPYFVDYFVLV